MTRSSTLCVQDFLEFGPRPLLQAFIALEDGCMKRANKSKIMSLSSLTMGHARIFMIVLLHGFYEFDLSN
eukprot:9514831-Karenia_brevis.AAC.1